MSSSGLVTGVAPELALEAEARHQPFQDFDHNSPECWADIDAYVDRARHTARVSWSPHYGGFWLVTRAQEAKWIAQHPEIFSSGRHAVPEGHSNIMIPPLPLMRPPILEELDPPEHGKYRRLVNVTLAPREVKHELQPKVHKLVTSVIDRFIEKGECDFVTDFTLPSPVLIILDTLGFPLHEWERFAAAFHRYGASFHDDPASPEVAAEELQHVIELAQWVDEQCRQLAELRTREPIDDVASRWLTHEVDGAPITTERVAMLLWHLMVGGSETTGSLVSSVLQYLYEHPEDKQRLIDDPDLLETATEEFIRFFPPAKAHGRVVVRDVEVAGCQMKAGEKVLLSWASINRDEEVFGENSTQLVLDRFPNRHASFSYGPHRCPGSHLARESFREMITQVLTRLPDYEIRSEHVTRSPDQSAGFISMPAVFPPGKRSGVGVDL